MLTNPQSLPKQFLPLQASTDWAHCVRGACCEHGAVWFRVLSLQELSPRATWPLSIGYVQPSHCPSLFPCQEPESMTSHSVSSMAAEWWKDVRENETPHIGFPQSHLKC